MHHQTGSLRHQGVVVLNPQTGEVIGETKQSINHQIYPDTSITSHHFSKNFGITNTMTTATDGNVTQNANGISGSGSHPPHNYPYRSHEQVPNGGQSIHSGGTGGGSHSPVTGGNLERARQAFNMFECQMAQLTVFLDRALVCRRIRPRFNASEITEVLFEHLSPAIDKDSIRVEIRGAATILDVSFSARLLTGDEDSWAQATSDLMHELRQCKRQASSLLGRISRTEKQRAVLETFADSLNRREDDLCNTSAFGLQNHPSGNSEVQTTAISTPISLDHKVSNEINPYDPRNIETLHRFLEIYKEEAERLDATLLDTTEELEQVRDRIVVIEKELHDIELKQDEHLARELSVLVEPRENGQVEMLVSYVVNRCGWQPAYDIRIFNSDGTMKIVYYGMVQQATGEDWETRCMTLSTALPGVGGTVPHLGLQRVHFLRDHSPSIPIRNVTSLSSHCQPNQIPPAPTSQSIASCKARTASKLGGFRRSARSTATSFHEADRVINETERDSVTPIGTLQRGSSMENTRGNSNRTTTSVRRTQGPNILFNTSSSPSSSLSNRSATPAPTTHSPHLTGSIATIQLEVPRPPDLIRCDNEPNRVTVGLLDLQPHYEYVTVPKLSLSAYLKATAINRTDFSILAGPTNIYADNTFIGKSELRAVAPGEEFTCHLGAESGVKVFYRPLFKYRESTGSSKNVTMTFKQLIEVRNSFDRPIRLTVIDQVPVSGEDKIKINLLEPVIKHPEKYDKNKPIRMNKCNNVEWDLDLGPGEVKELTLKYSVEHPVNEDLDVSISES